MKKKLLGIVTAFTLLFTIMPPIEAKAEGSTTYTFEMTFGQSEARTMMSDINAFRKGSDAWAWNSTNTQKVYYTGLEDIVYDYGLEKDAMQRAAEVAIIFSHTRPNGGRGLLYRTNPNGILGENIAAGHTSAGDVFVGWREDDEDYNGQGHRRNMLHSGYKYIGIGHVYYNGYNYWVQEFGSEPTDLNYSAPNDELTRVNVEILNNNITGTTYSLAKTYFYLGEGESVELPAVYPSLMVSGHWPSDQYCVLPATSASWSSANSGIAKINGNTVMGMSGGKTTLTASRDGWSGSVDITVEGVSRKAGVEPSNVSLYVGETKKLTATVYPTATASQSVTWSSSDTSIATVSSDGVVTAVGAGSALITAKPKENGASGSCTVTVVKKESNPGGGGSSGGGSGSGGSGGGSGSGGSGGGSGVYRNLEWEIVNGKSYWYENNIRQGTYSDGKCFSYDGTLRGREIYDPNSDGWYWLDVNADGAKAVGKEVFMPYVYQDEKNWSYDDISNNAAASSANADGNYEHAELAAQVKKAIQEGTGKWVRYDSSGKMLKGWVKIEGELADLYPDQAGNIYYYDRKTGLMAKGYTVIDGTTYHFDEITGVLK